jgi:hypothetical protein
VWFEGNGGADLEWYMRLPNNQRALINDPDNVTVGLKAFRNAPPVTAPTEVRFNPPTVDNGQVTLSWTSAGTLQESSNLIDWSTSANQANPQTVTPDGANPARFYRILVQ